MKGEVRSARDGRDGSEMFGTLTPHPRSLSPLGARDERRTHYMHSNLLKSSNVK